MKLIESGQYIFITIEDGDWRIYGRRLLEKIKTIPGRIYNSQTKEWKILKSRLTLLSEFLPTFTDQELLQGEKDLQDFLSQFDDADTTYSL